MVMSEGSVPEFVTCMYDAPCPGIVVPQVKETCIPLMECETLLAAMCNAAPWPDEDCEVLWVEDDIMLLVVTVALEDEDEDVLLEDGAGIMVLATVVIEDELVEPSVVVEVCPEGSTAPM